MNELKVGFIGAGNIAKAIISGIINSGYVKHENVSIFDVSTNAYDKFSSLNVTRFKSAVELADNCDYIFLTVKPQICPTVLDKIKNIDCNDKVFVTVCAGLKIDFFKKCLGEKAKIVRIMPNTPLMVGCGASALTSSDEVSCEEFDFVKGMFDASGKTVVVPEKLFSVVTALSGSGPAYFFKIAEVLSSCGEKEGMSESDALFLTAQTMIGAAEMLLNSGVSAADLRRMVTSPNGTTQAAIEAFEETGLDDSLKAGFAACVRRADELSQIG